SLFAAPAAAIRIIFLLHALPEPARKLAKTLDQGFRTIQRFEPGADILQPRQIGLAGLLAEGNLSVLLFPKSGVGFLMQGNKLLPGGKNVLPSGPDLHAPDGLGRDRIPNPLK